MITHKTDTFKAIDLKMYYDTLVVMLLKKKGLKQYIFVSAIDCITSMLDM